MLKITTAHLSIWNDLDATLCNNGQLLSHMNIRLVTIIGSAHSCCWLSLAYNNYLTGSLFSKVAFGEKLDEDFRVLIARVTEQPQKTFRKFMPIIEMQLAESESFLRELKRV